MRCYRLESLGTNITIKCIIVPLLGSGPSDDGSSVMISASGAPIAADNDATIDCAPLALYVVPLKKI
jgi:hypothetical protein